MYVECGTYPIVSCRKLTAGRGPAVPAVRGEEAPPAGVYDFWLDAPGIARAAAPGQFVDVRSGERPLRRPLSLCGADRERGLVRLVFEVRGEGTAWLAARRPGERLDLLGPLGNGFDPAAAGGKGALFVGGGVGVPPLLFAARRFTAEKRVGPSAAALGFGTAGAVMLAGEFEAAGVPVSLATDDGTAGFHGLVTASAEKRLEAGGVGAVYACGPLPMLRNVKTLAERFGVRCQLSMEQRMACGMGACLCCAVETVEPGAHRFRHVCKDGPVFDAETLKL